MACSKATEADASDEDNIPVLALIGQVGAGKSLLATALAGLPQENEVFMVGDSVTAVTLETVCHRARWFGLSTEEELLLLDPPGVGDGEGRDAAHLAKVICVLQHVGRVNSFLVVLNSAQPRMGSTLNNLLQLMEECFGRQFWRHVVLVFTRYYTDAHSARRRGGRTQAAIRSEFSAALAAQFPNAMSQRIPPGEPFPCYFVDSEAVVNTDMPDTERNAAMLELERLSVMARSTPPLPTMHSAVREAIGKQESTSSNNTSISLGMWVCIDGLPDMSALRSSEGRVVEIQAEGWYVVELADGSRRPFRTEHLKHPADEFKQMSTSAKVKIHGLVSSSALNGQVGHIVQYDSASQRYQVKLANGTIKFIQAKNLDKIAEEEMADEPELLALNAKVKVHGLTNSPELNGKIGIVVGLPTDSQRCTVMLSDGSRKSIRFSNLQEVCVKALPGETVDSVNISNGSLVERGLGWTWGDQDGGQGGLGRVVSWDHNKLWTKVCWYAGPTNSYRIGADGNFDLKFADEESYEEDYQRALKAGKKDLKAHHLQRTFFYSSDPHALQFQFYDIRADVCKCIGGFTHGQVVQWQGHTAKVVGVAPTNNPEGLHLHFHIDIAAGPGLFEEGDRLLLTGTSDVHEARRDQHHAENDEPDNEALAEMVVSLEPSFLYVEGIHSWARAELKQYDIRDEICRSFGAKHGQVLEPRPDLMLLSGLEPKSLPTEQLVIGVRLIDQRPHLFLHEQGHPGAGVLKINGLANRFIPSFLQVVSTRQIKEARLDELDPPPPSEKLNEIAKSLRGTFNYPKGTLAAVPALFDIRDHVCVEVGGFRHGQVVRDEDGDKAVVIGVLDTGDKDPTQLSLWFHSKEHCGAGKYDRYHLQRRDLKLIGTKSVQEVPTDHHMYRKAAGFSAVLEHLEHLLKHCQSDDAKDNLESSTSKLGFSDHSSHRGSSDSASNEQVPMLSKNLAPKFQGHDGDDSEDSGKQRTSTRKCDGHDNDAEDLGDPCAETSWTSDLSFTFNYPVAEGQLSLERFDIRDDICLQVGGYTHGQVLQLASSADVVVVVVGVMMAKGVPLLFTHTLEPERNLGATFIGDLRKMSVISKGVEEVTEVTDVEFTAMRSDAHVLAQTSKVPSQPEGSNVDKSAEDGFTQSDSVPEEAMDMVAKAVLQGKMSSEQVSNAVVYRLTRCSVDIAKLLLESADLAVCHARVRVAGYELQPCWANGAILFLPLTEAQVKEAGLELRAHNIVALPEDEERIKQVLSGLPCRQRPKLRFDGRAKEVTQMDDSNENPSSGSSENPTDNSNESMASTHANIEMYVERTFLHFPTSDAPSETSSMIHSAPCGGANGEQSNPRRFKTDTSEQ